jgi:hypothetical protein
MGGTGESIPLSGRRPDRRARATFHEGNRFVSRLSCSVPVGGSPTGTGGSPVLSTSGGNGYEISGLAQRRDHEGLINKLIKNYTTSRKTNVINVIHMALNVYRYFGGFCS